MKNIVLVGFMGTGKSAAGRMLARRLKRPFLDLDRQIERAAGLPIPKIFESQGEAAFRALESNAVKEAVRLTDHVIATGGGVMADEENVKALKKSGLLICLTARSEVILERTVSSLPSRPLLSGPNPRERIEELLKLRAPFYAKADMAIDTSDRSIPEVVEEILQWVKNADS